MQNVREQYVGGTMARADQTRGHEHREGVHGAQSGLTEKDSSAYAASSVAM
jgi:hypothetical protein